MSLRLFAALLTAALGVAVVAAEVSPPQPAAERCACAESEVAPGSARQVDTLTVVIAEGPRRQAKCGEYIRFEGCRRPGGEHQVEWNGRRYTIHYGPVAARATGFSWFCGEQVAQHDGVGECCYQTVLDIPVMQGMCARNGMECVFLGSEGKQRLHPIKLSSRLCGKTETAACKYAKFVPPPPAPEVPGAGPAQYTSPPSRYVGGGFEYDFLSYGDPAPENSTYTGYWRGFFDGSNAVWIDGNYQDGIPVGTWREFYRNGNLRSVMTYDGAGHYEQVAYYPDGTVGHTSRGTYEFSGGKAVTTIEFTDAVSSFVGNRDSGWRLPKVKGRVERSSSNGRDDQGRCWVLTYEWIYEGNALSSDIYVMEDKYLGRVYRFAVSGRLNSDTGKLEDVRIDTILGEGTAKIERIENAVSEDGGPAPAVAGEARVGIMVLVPTPGGGPTSVSTDWSVNYIPPRSEATTKK